MVKVVKVPMVSMAMMVKRNKMVQVPNIFSRPSWALAHDGQKGHCGQHSQSGQLSQGGQHSQGGQSSDSFVIPHV